MTLLPQSVTETSAVITTVSRVRAQLSAAAADARSMTLVRRLGLIADMNTPDSDEQATSESAPTADPSPDSFEGSSTDTAETTTEAAASATEAAGTDTGSESPTETTPSTAGEPTATDTSPPSSRQSVTRSRTYALARRGRRFVMSSWLYGWLTAEPEPEVIVIDLRETRIVGAGLRVIDRVVTRSAQDLLPALPSATATRVSYWLRDRAAARPLRVVSIGAALVANLGLLIVLVGESDPLQPVTLLLFAVLLAAARGFQSTTSWGELTSTTWYQRTTSALIAAFEPPEPPEPAGDRPVATANATDGDQSSGEESDSDSLDSSDGGDESNTVASDSTTGAESDPDTVDETDTDDSGSSDVDLSPTDGSTPDLSDITDDTAPETDGSDAAIREITDDPASTTDNSDQSTEEEPDEPN